MYIYLKIVYCTLAVFIISFSSCANKAAISKTSKTERSESVKSSAPDWKLYEGNGYKIEYPESWQLLTANNIGAEFIVMPSEQTNPTFKDNFNLMIQDLALAGEEITIDRYTEITLKQIEENIGTDGLSPIVKGKNSIGEYCDLSYSGRYNGFDLKWKQRYYLIENKVYLLTYTAHGNSYEKHLMQMNRLIGSFRFK
jgi:hypothetical protein